MNGQTYRGYLWLSCTTNAARGDLVERLCQWHRKNLAMRRKEQQQQRRHPHQTEAHASVAAAAAVGADSPPKLARVVGESAGGSGAAKASEFARGQGERPGVDGVEEELENEDGVLEVDQVPQKELIADLMEERSLNVTALLVADEDILATLDVE
ncbi:unnamed protein product [Sphacelaria rigidula]